MTPPESYYYVHLGSEYLTSLVFEFSKVVRSPNGPVLEYLGRGGLIPPGRANQGESGVFRTL